MFCEVVLAEALETHCSKYTPVSRLYAFTDTSGKTKPGMVRPLNNEGCNSVELEVWEMPIENFGRFIEQVSLGCK